MSYPYVFSVLPPYQLYLIARFGTIPFSRYRIVQGTHLNSPPLHHPLTASRYRRSTATDLDRERGMGNGKWGTPEYPNSILLVLLV
ncbi:Molybdopterin biosynthesis protein MoeB [Geitlerinema sp. FC II]|nr:Molybdopterin biosynthesis protein MoeB [Geitlerinema sp. FC II]